MTTQVFAYIPPIGFFPVNVEAKQCRQEVVVTTPGGVAVVERTVTTPVVTSVQTGRPASLPRVTPVSVSRSGVVAVSPRRISPLPSVMPVSVSSSSTMMPLPTTPIVQTRCVSLPVVTPIPCPKSEPSVPIVTVGNPASCPTAKVAMTVPVVTPISVTQCAPKVIPCAQKVVVATSPTLTPVSPIVAPVLPVVTPIVSPRTPRATKTPSPRKSSPRKPASRTPSPRRRTQTATIPNASVTTTVRY